MMKSLCILCVVVFCALSWRKVNAQQIPVPHRREESKTSMFDRLPQRSSCNPGILERLFKDSVNDDVDIRFNENFVFKGVITAKVKRSSGVISMTIRSDNFPGAVFTVSMIPVPGKPYLYNGRILHPRYRDILILTQEAGRYYFHKQDENSLITE